MDGNKNITWAALVEMEPRLGCLYNYAQSVQATTSDFCANDIWYDRIKPVLLTLVGWYAVTDNETLTSSEAYELAVNMIYDQLPACRDCACI
jgi:hypothetical protein